jgi:SnoaL-like domain
MPVDRLTTSDFLDLMNDALAQQLLDRIEVTEAVYRYAQGIDSRDWLMYRSIFGVEVFIDFSSFNGQPATKIPSDDWVARVRPLFMGLDATQHTMTNPIVQIDGDDATCTMYMRADHVLTRDSGEVWFSIGGYYVDTLRRTQDTWLITGVTLNVRWSKGDPSIMTEARKRNR